MERKFKICAAMAVMCIISLIIAALPAYADDLEAGEVAQADIRTADDGQAAKNAKAKKIAKKSKKAYKKLKKHCKKATKAKSKKALSKAKLKLEDLEDYFYDVSDLGHAKSKAKVKKYWKSGKKMVKKAEKAVKKASKSSSLSRLRNAGVVYSGGWKYTWYSQRVLPGGGLGIPGRHVGAGGGIYDGSGRLCVASSSHARGSVISTPFGTAKVYDTGCAGGVIDVYVNW